LVDDRRLQRLTVKEERIDATKALLETQRQDQVTLTKYLCRPEVSWDELKKLLPQLEDVSPIVAQQVLYDVKYAGYISRQELHVAKQQRSANKRIPEHFDYASMNHLRAEAREKLLRVRPTNLAQAQRISGITPADVALIMAYLENGNPSKQVSEDTQPASK
jgi:tRNA uridine 5-carboxymethylaminomethyl modification enzyme